MSTATKTKTVVHLVTQDDQPYGSSRKSCEQCGYWVIGNPSCSDLYVDDRPVWYQLKAETKPDIETCRLT